jgi:hypothetical protein
MSKAASLLSFYVFMSWTETTLCLLIFSLRTVLSECKTWSDEHKLRANKALTKISEPKTNKINKQY